MLARLFRLYMIFSKIFTKKTFFILIILGIVCFLFFYFINKNSIRVEYPILAENNTVALNQEQINIEPLPEPIIENIIIPQKQNIAKLPVRIKIPKINVDAIIEYVGLTSLGGVDIPEGPINAAWFKFGPRPGDPGNAIIIGHYGWKNNIVAVFDDIYKLVKGDKVYIEDEDGKVITFIVRESRSYDPKADASFVFVSSDDKSHLNLITCEGIWNKALKSYSKRLVVFTDRE